MENILTLDKSVFNVSKNTLNYLTGKVSLYKSKTMNKDKCSNCDLLKLSHSNNNPIKNYCESYCTKEDIKLHYVFTRQTNKYKYKKLKPAKLSSGLKSKKSLKYTKAQLSLVNYRFSELQIKQALLYYYLCNSNGIIQGIEKKKLAESLKCTVKTIENNNKVFMEHNLFNIKPDCPGSIYVRIHNYEGQYQNKKDKKDKDTNNIQGYMLFVTSVFKKILNSDEIKVNELRFLLKTLAKFDFNYKKKHRTKFMFNDIKNFLANNFHSFKSFSTLAEILNNVFKDLLKINVIKNNEITVDLVDEVHGRFIKNTHLEKSKALLRKLSYDNNFMIKSKEYVDSLNNINKSHVEETILQNLGELSIEYGYNFVKEQLLNLGGEMGSIKNFGGLIRDKIKRHINANRAILKLI